MMLLAINQKLLSGPAATAWIQQARAPTQQARPAQPWGGRRGERQKGRRYVIVSDDHVRSYDLLAEA